MPSVYLNGHETDARLANGKMEVSRPDEEKDDVVTRRIPFFDIERVVVQGRAGVTVPLIHKLIREKIPVAFLTGGGRWLGSIEPNCNGHALRRMRQYDLARDKSFALDMARAAVCAKIRNSRRVLQRMAANRKAANDPEQRDACNSLLSLTQRAQEAEDLEKLRGCEGYAANLYFERLRAFFPEDTPFVERSRRPPRDAANALLSWTYTIVLGEVDGAVRAAGLDSCLGFLHQISYGRPSLSLDLLEPLRGPLCDMLVLRLLNHRLIRADEHFEYNAEDGGTYLSKEGRKVFFVEYERSMMRRFAAAKGEPHTDFRRVIRDQVHSLLHAMDRNSPLELFAMP